MTITISVDQASIRSDAGRRGVDFEFTEGVHRRRVHVPYDAIADRLKVGRLLADQAVGYVRNHALRIALALAGRGADRSADREIVVDPEILRQAR